MIHYSSITLMTSSQVSSTFTRSDNTSGTTADAHTAGSYAQSHTITNDYGVTYTYPFTLVFQNCANITANVDLATADNFTIAYATPHPHHSNAC